ncbi:MAG TPA: DEAD/DEAH box helicase [Verrucomicrobiae bacterium]|nr:DEAD/DEAH box helicase [Verrucomicrobiae bacterium]
MLFDTAALERSFDPQTIARARGYVAGNRITNVRLSEQGEAASATVQGSATRPYAVGIAARERDGVQTIESECSCPDGHACKHGAALALKLLDRDAGAGGASDGAVDAWTRRMLETFGKSTAVQKNERLLYVIDAPESHGLRSVRLVPYVMPAAGNSAQPREFSFHNFKNSQARFITGIDVVAGRLAGASGLLGLGQDLSPAIFAMLLELLATHELLRWHDASSEPLERVPISDAALVWETGNDGLVRVRLAQHADAILLPTSPLWYVDPPANRAGPVGLDLLPELAATIARAPAFSPAQAQRVQIALHRLLRGTGIEGPSQDSALHIDEREPQPVLRLLAVEGGRASGSLVFAYGDQLVSPNDPRDSIRVALGENTTVWPRDRAFERSAQEQLARLDFPPYGEDAWLQFLERDAPQLRRDGWRIETTPSFPFRIVEAGDEWSAEVYDSGAAQWFELELGIDVDGARVSLLPVLIDALGRSGLDLDADPAALVRRQAPFVGRIPGGGYVALPVDRVARVLATLGGLFDDRRSGSKARVRIPVLQAASLAAAGGIATRWSNAPSIRAMLDDLAAYAQRSVEIPAAFIGELRPYQRDGVAWLQTLREHRAGGILADDMGLGKTVEVLAHVAIERAAGRSKHPVLVVSPTSVAPNWRAEIARFLPDARVVALTGADRADRFAQIGDATFVLTTYALLLRDVDALAAFEWSIAVLDEAQAIKNPRSKVALAASRLQAAQRLALTGTPIENHLEELWSIFAFAVPGLLPERSRFNRLFGTPIEKRGDADRRAALGARIKPFLLRRTKEGVAQELPEKTEIVQRVPLVGRQRDLYETIRLTMHKRVRDEIERRGLGRSRIVVLDALLKLRQVCCDPRLLKLDAAAGVEESQKLDALLEMLESLVEDGRRILLFSQFTSMLDLIVPELGKRNLPFVELRGDTRDRVTPVARFQNGDVPLFLISLKAGGTGLNLTAADTVIHYDPWWNPAVERQATDRAHRIGQEQHVFVYKLIAEDTVEERILELQERKASLAATLFDEAANPTVELDLADIDRLFN